ncbi:MAG TPA: FecR domain-containing protein [Caulobacter sp.]|nr:FecR domain-containing protein [Caulobacter sp.]
MTRRGLWIGLAALAAAACAAGAAPAQPDPRTIDYVVRPGDTLSGLATRYLLRPADYRAVQDLNAVREPRRMPHGLVLRIPVRLLRTSPAVARVVNFRGAVTVTRNGRPVEAAVGLEVGEGAVVATGANAFVRLALPDGGHVSLPSRSRVRIARLRTVLLTGATDQAFQVEAGRTETQAAPVAPSGGFTIGTPMSVSAVRGTEFRVAYDPQGNRSATEVLEGTVAVEAGGKAILARAAEAVSVDATGAALTSLLPAPELRRPDDVQSAETVSFDLSPTPGAALYRARLATDAGMTDAFAETESPAGGPVVFADLADGAYFVRLTAVAPDGVEGRPSVYSFIRARNGLGALGSSAVGQGRDRRYLFRWEAAGAGEARFRFQLRLADATGPPMIDEAGLTEPRITLTGLPPGVYEWRVRATRQAFGRTLETWSPPQQLRIGR